MSDLLTDGLRDLVRKYGYSLMPDQILDLIKQSDYDDYRRAEGRAEVIEWVERMATQEGLALPIFWRPMVKKWQRPA